MPEPGPEYFEGLKHKISGADDAHTPPIEDGPQPERMRWRKEDDYHIKSDKGFIVSKVGGKYTCWAPSKYRVNGVKVHTGYIGFHYTEDGEQAKQACQKLFADPEDFIPTQDGRLNNRNSGEVEPAREDQAGPVRVHRHSGAGQVDDTGHTDLFAQ